MLARFSCLFRSLLLSFVLLLVACSTGVPDGVKAMTTFDIQRYQGQWYEVARLDHRFERGLSHVTAQYSPQPNGDVSVVNRGFNAKDMQWKQAEGVAKFLDAPDVGSFKVSFFGPFYGGYHVIALDRENYQWAMVAGADKTYLWLLSRQPNLPDEVKTALLAQAQRQGFDTQKLIWVDHAPIDPKKIVKP
jgi:apolipoprotein D and lipocalin family protein